VSQNLPRGALSGAYFSDAEVDELCDGLTQYAAMVRYLRRLGLRVDRKPNGRPLAWRPSEGPGQEQNQPAPANAAPGLNIVGLQAWASSRKGRSSGGQKAKGR